MTDAWTCIAARRSVRAFKDLPVSREAVEKILRAGIAAPSSKNRQPWQFTVLTDKAKEQACDMMRAGLERERKDPLLPLSAPYLSGAERTLLSMRQAPVLIFVHNRLGKPLREPLCTEERVSEICNMQSIGACMQNMALAATASGLGSLWICDVFFAHDELRAYLPPQGEPIAAMAIGYADGNSSPSPRRSLADSVVWKTE